MRSLLDSGLRRNDKEGCRNDMVLLSNIPIRRHESWRFIWPGRAVQAHPPELVYFRKSRTESNSPYVWEGEGVRG